MTPIFRVVKTATVEEFTEHVADYLGCVEAGEEVALSREGRVVARVSPAQASKQAGATVAKPDFKARFLAMWGPDALGSTESVSAQFEALRSDRRL